MRPFGRSRGGKPPRPKHLAVLAVPLLATPAVAGDPMAGKEVAEDICGTCHGIDGIAKLPVMPNIAGSDANYLAAQLKAYKAGERFHEQMSIIAEGLEDQEIEDVAAWYASIDVSATLPE